MMKMALAGDPKCSTGVGAAVELPTPLQTVKWALHDTMLQAYYSAFAGEPDAHPPVAEMYPIVYTLLRLALVVTSADIA
jgi:hypothetical protein